MRFNSGIFHIVDASGKTAAYTVVAREIEYQLEEVEGWSFLSDLQLFGREYNFA